MIERQLEMGGNGGGGGGGDGVTVVGRAEIDMRAPFRSVKEAVVLFGEKETPLLAGDGDVHGPGLHRLRLMNRAATTPPAIWPTFSQQQVSGGVVAVTRHVPAELEEARQELEKERSEKQKMAGCILSLQEELSNAMSELNKIKARDDVGDGDGGEAAAKVIDLQVEDLKFVEIDDDKPQPRQQSPSPGEFQKRRYVTFADPPPPMASAYDRAPPQAPLPDVVIELRHRHNHSSTPSPPQLREVRFMRQMSASHGMMKAAAVAAVDQEGRKKKKSLIPLVGALFMRKKKSSSCSCHNDDSALNPRTSF
ncbi:hypothetical protein DAI22_04g007200 [Oryza sativa Japonica Group]|nr:hypothetical protein DAI22_04g007200 [Oryza sativa Japonica Group]